MPKAKSHKTMNWVLLCSSSVPPTLPALWSGLSHKITPSVLLIIIILTIIFFLSGLFHLIVRFLVSFAATRYREDYAEGGITALQGQLWQLFHLHDAGLDKSFIDAIPVFLYKAVIRSRNNPFACAVCLCEFEPEDVLRLIPKCCHAFHMECIDTWLLSHSTCPLCRANLLDFENMAERPEGEASGQFLQAGISFRFPITRNQEAAGSELRWQECNDEGEQSNHSGLTHVQGALCFKS